MNIDRKWRIFVSSTDLDLKYARGAVAEKLSLLDFEPVMFEKGSFIIDSDLNAHESCINSVRTSDIFILILDKRLGSPYLGIKENPSITQMEYATALECKIPIIVFVSNSLEQERYFHANIIKNSNKNLSAELLIKKLNHVVTSYAESGKLIAFLQSIYHQYSSNFITYFNDLAQLIEGIERRLKSLTPTILRLLSTTQNTNIKTRATVLGKEYNTGTLIKSGFLVKQEFFEGESSKIYNFDLAKFTKTSSINFNIVLGFPGTGKSIFMSKLFLDLSNYALNHKTIDMPIYFDLRNIHTKGQFSASGIIEEAFRMFLKKEVYPLLDFNLVNLIFILDGLDEISEHLIKDIVYEKGLQDFSTFKGFLSVRNTFFDIYVRGSKLEQDISSILNLRKWTVNEGISFISKWLKSEVSKELSNDFKNHAKYNQLDEILTSPIMSSMYAFSIKYLSRIPKQISDRATLYQHFMHVLALRETQKKASLMSDQGGIEKIKKCWHYISWIIYRYRLELESLYLNELKNQLNNKGFERNIINQSIAGLVVINKINNEVKSLIHETMLEYLLASFGVTGMNTGDNEINLFLDCTLASDVSSFVKEIWKRSTNNELHSTVKNLSIFIKDSSKSNDEKEQRRAANAIYYLSRVPLKDEVISELKNLLDNSLSIFLKNGILFALTKLGDFESEELLANDLINNEEANNLNRGLHIEYFGDIEPNTYFPPRDPGQSNIDKSIHLLLEHLRRSNERDATTSRIDTITVLSLCATRKTLNDEIISQLTTYLNQLKYKYNHITDIPEKALNLLNHNPLKEWESLKKYNN